MRLFALLTILLTTQTLISFGQRRRGPTRNRNGWANSEGLQAALRRIGVGAGAGRERGSINLDEVLRTLGRTSRGTVTPPPATTHQPTTGGTQSTQSTQTTLTQQTLDAIKEEFENLFGNPRKIPAYVQMGFHICVGGCDGCLNTADSSNTGLIPTYRELRSLYTKWENVISLADFAVLSAYGAIRAGVERNTNGCFDSSCSIDLAFTSGRITCENPDFPPTDTVFSKGEDVHSTQGLIDAFRLSNREMVALLGCHSLGSAHPEASGFEGPWDLTPTVLDNGYFQALNRVTWTQEFKDGAGANQWSGRTRSGRDLMMLQVDMSLKHKFTVSGPNHLANCSITTDCPQAPTSSIIDDFADDTTDFYRELSRAMTKMCNTANFNSSKMQVFN